MELFRDAATYETNLAKMNCYAFSRTLGDMVAQIDEGQ